MDLFLTAVNIVSDVMNNRDLVTVKLTGGHKAIPVYETMHLDSKILYHINDGDTILVVKKMDGIVYILFNDTYGFAYIN